uniref:Transmembrane protein 258 n=1 Tax=Panagrolaimus sp. PS1159 TaxID=55785 RepID=A0AC35FQ77_9BILA
MAIDITQMEKYGGPINPMLFSQFTFIFVGLGLVATAYFFIQEVTVEAKKRNLITEFLLAFMAAGFLGFGIIFLALWVGIYL